MTQQRYRALSSFHDSNHGPVRRNDALFMTPSMAAQLEKAGLIVLHAEPEPATAKPAPPASKKAGK